MCEQILFTSSTSQNKKKYINLSSETLKLWVIAERILCTYQQQFSVNVWEGSAGECLVGPHPPRGNHSYMTCQSCWKLYERGACMIMLRHIGRAVRDVLKNTYQDRWIITGGHRMAFESSGNIWKRLCTQRLLPTKGHFTTAVWMPVRLSATIPTSLKGRGGPWWDVSRRALNLM
jgi:hypothetical protein